MSERIPFREAPPDQLEVRRDSLLLRIKEMQDKLNETTLDPKIATLELAEFAKKIQEVRGPLDMDLFESLVDSLENNFDSHRP